MSNLRDRFKNELVFKLKESLGIKNPLAAPRLAKIVVNMGIKDALVDKKNIEQALMVLGQICGQKPKQTKARKSIASFKLREGDVIGLMVTLRGKRMYDFFDKLATVILPRFRDFHGLKDSFDEKGNFTIGIPEYTVFPEVDPGEVDKIRGFEVTIVTTAKNKEEAKALLKELGMPFKEG